MWQLFKRLGGFARIGDLKESSKIWAFVDNLNQLMIQLRVRFLFLPNRHVRETITITSTENTDGIVQVEEVDKKPVRIIPGPADVREDEDFNSGPWVGATEYVKANGGIVSGCLGDIKTFLKNGKLEQVVAIIKSCSLNALGHLKVTVKDLSGTLAGLIHYKVINTGGKTCSEMLMEEEEIVKLVKEEKMADLELHVCGNVIDQEDLYKFVEEAIDFVLEKEAMESKAHEEWLKKCRQQEEEDAEHERQLLGFHGTNLVV
nr:hypothetical protein [Tanacetum cinerariifolium]